MADTGFDLAEKLRGAAELNGQKQIEYIPFKFLVPDEENGYSMDGLDALAGSIETLGIQEPLLVWRDGSEETMRITSGHRRHAAFGLLVKEGKRTEDDPLPCIVDRTEKSKAMRDFELLMANRDNRKKTPADLSCELERLADVLRRLVDEEGWEPKGRLRDWVSEISGESRTKIARLHAIRNNLKPELLNCFDRGILKVSAAYELQKLPMDVQRYLAGKKKVIEGAVSVEGVALCAERCESYLHPDCKCPDGSACSHTLPRFYQTATTRWNDCRGACCLKCRYTESECPYQCSMSKKRTEERREKDRIARTEHEKELSIIHEKNRAELAGRYAALAVLAKDAGLKGSDVVNVPGAYSVADLELKATDPTKITDYDARSPSIFDEYSYVRSVRGFADQVGVSVDFLLGRTKEPKINTGEGETASAPAPASGVEPHWMKGTPPRAGRYFVRVKGNADDEVEPPKEFRFDWDGERWYFAGREIMKGMLVLDWWPLPDAEG